MDEIGADGVDFCPICFSLEESIKRVFLSKTREEMIADPSYPKSNRLYWKKENGEKHYLIKE